ncbi:MAG: DMT family transporter [Kofleriaceae bacterium]
MLCFAANSLLSRAALRGGSIDAASFTAIRLATGALVLVLLAASRRERVRSAGSWASAAALATYAVAFTFAYRELTAGTGALLLFGAVQLTMIAGALIRGERPSPIQWVGWLIAIGGLGVITAPTLDPPPLTGALLMLAAGIAWGIYSLRGRGVARPLATTADNFLRTVPVALLRIAFARHLTVEGAVLAAASGGLASGVGYSVWYAAVPALGATRAAAVQLSVPVLTALAAMLLFSEALTPTLAGGGSAIVVGLALALTVRR